ncbi:PREDICTED: putative F-box protein At3g23950 [Theobroma cacao]|uniref:F-box protein At3g23950 n=1 Tax=Theobroma cacao TaxID=3641 RepID=A0AB32VBY7_THECC|nr:PREDICTED: putative F-box protein At3g23950 [Theobroma cacao]
MDVAKREKSCKANAPSPSGYSASDNLDESLLLEIFCRLPCKSAHRFKCVSKRWFSIISDSYFIQRLLLAHPQPPPFTLLFKYESNDQQKMKVLITSKEAVFRSQGFSLSFLPCFKANEKDPVNIIASCNGLLLCSSAATKACPTVYYICNPLTKQWFALPPVYHCNQEAYSGLICENEGGAKGGNGTFSINDQYKYRVVCIVRHSKTDLAVKIFSSETGIWKEIFRRYRDYYPMVYLHHQAIAYEGVLHWWSPLNRSFVTCDPYNKDGNLRFSFALNYAAMDLAFEECPGVCKGRLRLCQQLLSLTEGFSIIRVWNLEEDHDGGKWCLKHEFFLHELESEVTQLVEYARCCSVPRFRLLSVDPYDENIIYMSCLGSIVSCNMEGKTLEIVSEYPAADGNSQQSRAYPFHLPWWPTPVPSYIN